MKPIATTPTLSVWWSIFNVLHCIARGNNNNDIFSVVLQGATTMVDCNKGACKITQASTYLFDWCRPTTSTIAKAQGASNKIDCNAMMTMLTMQQSFFNVLLQEAMTVKDEGKGKQYDSQSTIKRFCHHLQDSTTTILHHATNSGANMPRLSMVSKPKTVCTLPRVSKRVHHRQHVRCWGQECWVHRRGCVYWRGPQQASCQRGQQWTPCQGWQPCWVWQWAPCHKGNQPRMLCKAMMSPLPQRALGPLTLCKATTSPLPQGQLGHNLWRLQKVPKHPQLINWCGASLGGALYYINWPQLRRAPNRIWSILTTHLGWF